MSNATHNINVVWQQTGLDQVNSAMSNFSQSTGLATQSQDALGASMQKTEGAAFKTGTEIQKTGQKTEQTAKTTTTLGQAFKSSALQLTAFVSGLVSTVMQYTQVLAAENKLEKMRGILERKTAVLQLAELKLKTQYDSGAISGEKYRLQSEKLAATRALLETDEERYNIKLQQTQATYLQMALQAIPTVINGVSAFGNIIGTVQKTMDAAKSSTDTLSESTEVLGTTADVATTTGIVPTLTAMGKMVVGAKNLHTAVGDRGGAGLAGGMGALSLAFQNTDKSGNIIIRAFQNIGSTIKTFFSNMKTDISSATGIMDKIKTGFSSFFTQIGTGFTALGGHLKAAGLAVVAFGKTLLGVFMSNPILLIIGAIATAIGALIFDVGGFRTRLNELGVTLGKMAPWAKPFLDVLGFIGQKFAEVGDWIMGTNQLAEATLESGLAAKQAAKDYEVQFQALSKTFVMAKDVSAFENIVNALKKVRTEMGTMTETTNVWGTKTVENLGNATNAFEIFNAGIQKGVPEIDAKVKAVQATFEGMRNGTISLAEGEKLLAQQLVALEQELLKNLQANKDVVKSDQERKAALDQTAGTMTEAEKIISNYNLTTQGAEDVFNDFAIALVKGNYNIIESMGLEREQIEELMAQFKQDFPDGAVVVEKSGQKIIKSITDIKDEAATATKEMGKHFEDVSKIINDNLPPTLADVELAIRDMTLEEQYAADVSKVATGGIISDKELLKQKILELAAKYPELGKNATDILKDIQTETDNQTKEQDKANKKTDETIVKIQNLSETRKAEKDAIVLETAAAQDLIKELDIQVDVVGMTGKGLLQLVDIYDETANATGIAADAVGLWWAELDKSQEVEDATIVKLVALAEGIGLTIPDAIRSKGIPAIKEYIEQVLGIGEGAKKAKDEALAAFDELQNKAKSALAGIISDKLGEDGDEIKKAIKGIAKVDSSINTIAGRQAMIEVFLNDSDYTNKVQSLDEVYNKEYGEIAILSQEQGTDVGDKFISNAIDMLGNRGKGMGEKMEAIWTDIKSSTSPEASGNEMIGNLARGLEKADLIEAAMQAGVKNPVATVLGLTDEAAQALMQKMPANLGAILESSKGPIEQASTIAIYDPITKTMKEVPISAKTELAPVEGIFSQAFLAASTAAGTQLATMVTDVHTKMSSMSTSVLTYSTSMTTNFTNFTTAVINALPPVDAAILVTQTAFSALSTNVLTYVTSMGTNIATFSTNAVTELTKLSDYVFNTVQQTFSNLSTNIATYSTSMTSNINNWLIETSAGFVDYVAIIKDGVQKAFSDLSSNVATYMKSMTTNIDNWASATTTSMDEVSTSANDTQGVLSDMSTSVATYMKSMTSHVQNFASSFGDSMDSIIQDAEDATSAVEDLQSAIDALKDKEITITVNLAGAGASRLQHGGSALNLNGPTYAAAGAAWVQNTPRKIGGTHVAETFPEIITAIPLDPKEKNSPFHNVGLDVPMPEMKSIGKIGSGGRGGGGGGGQPINVYGEIHITNTLGDGRVISEIVKPFMLKNYSGITSS